MKPSLVQAGELPLEDCEEESGLAVVVCSAGLPVVVVVLDEADEGAAVVPAVV